MGAGVDPVALGQRVVAVLETGLRTATYKLATLQGLIDFSVEHLPGDESEPLPVPLTDLAARVIEVYWPQVRPFEGHELRQSSQPVSRILRSVKQLQAVARDRGVSGPLDRVAAIARTDYEWAVREVVLTLVQQPLSRLQRLPGDDGRQQRFLYDDSWMSDATSWREINRHGAQLELYPGVASGLARIAGLLRPAIQLLWAEDVRRLNRATVGTEVPDIGGHLFGRSRVSLDAVRDVLADAFGPVCFYCQAAVKAASPVDHVLPWSRVGIDGLANLVLACVRCNQDKTNALPAVSLVSAALDRGRNLLDDISSTIGWPVQWERTGNAARGLYRAEPTGAATWRGYRISEPLAIPQPTPSWYS